MKAQKSMDIQENSNGDLRDLTHGSSKLKEMRGVFDTDTLQSLYLIFENSRTCHIYLNLADRSQLGYRFEDDSSHDRYHAIGISSPEIKKFYGMTVLWSWEIKSMHNELNGIQLELSRPEFYGTSILQLMADCSGIVIYTATQT